MRVIHPVIRDCKGLDPEMVLRALAPLPGIAFLDSGGVHGPASGRWSIIAADPFARFEIRNAHAFWNGTPIAGEPLAFLREKLNLYRHEVVDLGLPLIAGAMGYLSYEFGGTFETIPHMPRGNNNYPDVSFGFYDTVIIHDHKTGTTQLISTGLPEDDDHRQKKRARERVEEFHARLYDSPRALTQNPPLVEWSSNYTATSYKEAVANVIEAILRGDIFQANLSQCFTHDRPQNYDPLAFYLNLRRLSPAPYGALIVTDDITIASNSPERFLGVEKGLIEARPIKGTARRSSDPKEDRALAHALLMSEKDRAENIMIVDLLRNDLSRIAKPGSIDVPVLCGLETYANVHHLVSVITAHLKPDYDVLDVIRATFPGGSITGAPKIKAMDIIAEQEKTPRGPYCGSIGYISFDGRMDLNIAIRTASLTSDHIRFSAGGGITALSDPEAEYRETLVKAEKLFAAFRYGV